MNNEFSKQANGQSRFSSRDLIKISLACFVACLIAGGVIAGVVFYCWPKPVKDSKLTVQQPAGMPSAAAIAQALNLVNQTNPPAK
jgi:hypothetical protein